MSFCFFFFFFIFYFTFTPDRYLLPLNKVFIPSFLAIFYTDELYSISFYVHIHTDETIIIFRGIALILNLLIIFY